MRGFNPITDLRPPDPFNEPAGQSTEAIERIRTRLASTREKTAELVEIIKTKNISFKKDIDKIQELNRRLRKTIPRIPIMRGDAGTTSGDTIEEQFRRGFGLGFGAFARPRQKAPVKSAFPFLDLAIAGLLGARGKGLGKKTDLGAFNNIKNFTRQNNKPVVIPEIFIPSPGATKRGKQMFDMTAFADFLNKIFGKPNVLKPGSGNVLPFRRRPTFAPSKEVAKKRGTAFFEGDASQRTVDVDAVRVPLDNQNILERVTSLLNTRRLRKFSKEKGFLSFSKDADKIPRIPSLTRVQEQLLRMSKAFTKNFPKGFKPSLSKKGKLARQKFDPDDIFRGQESVFRTEKEMDSILDTVSKALRTGEIPLDSDIKDFKNTVRAFQDVMVDMMDSKVMKMSKMELDDILRELKQISEKGQVYRTRGNQKRIERFIKDIFKEVGTPLSNINNKPMSNDIAMLNTNTGFTRETIIITDSIG